MTDTGRVAWLASRILLAAVCILVSGVGTAVARVAPSAVVEYHSRFDVSSQRAEEALEAQQRGAKRDIVAQLEAQLGSKYAGVWFDDEAGEFVVPVVDGSPSEGIASDILDANGLQGDFRLARADSTWSELESVQARVGEEIAGWPGGGGAETFPDPKTNSVVIRLSREASLTFRERLESQIEHEPVDIRLQFVDPDLLKTQPTSCISERFCSAPLRGGVGIGPGNLNQFVCTAGFKATGRYTGNRYVLTAGHCPPDGDSEWVTYDPESGGHIRSIGTLEGRLDDVDADWAKFNANGTYWDQPNWPGELAYWGGLENEKWIVNEAVPVLREGTSYVGERVCHSGLTTGTHCSYVVGTDITTEYPAGVVTARHVTKFGPVCANGGDSGGPIFDEGTALGMVSFDILYRPVCEEYVYYYELTKATDEMGVTVAPRLPVVTTGGVTARGAHQATVAAQINPYGSPTSFHFEYGTTTGYGSSTATANAGSGWSSTELRQSIEGLRPSTTYHYRVVATNAAGTSYGSDMTFTTSSLLVAFRANTGNLFVYNSATGTKDLGMGMKPGTSPSITTMPDGTYRIAFQTNTGELFSYSPITGTKDIGGMAAGTSPSITAMPDGNYDVAFQANTGHLMVYNSATGTKDLGLGMKPGTSPSIAAKSDGTYIAAFQANTGDLVSYSPSSGPWDTGLAVKPETSPSVLPPSGGIYDLAFQGNDGDLFILPSTLRSITSIGGMATGTSPSAALMADGNRDVAFQANTGYLLVYNSATGNRDLGMGMKPGTSPSIAAKSDGTYIVALQTNTGELFSYSPITGTRDIGGMAAGTSPSVTVLPDGNYDVAFQANTGNLFVYNSATGNRDLGMGMKPGTSPSITTMPDGTYRIAFQTNTGELFSYSPITGTKDIGGMAAGTSPSITAMPDGNYDVAFQANTGNLFVYNSATGNRDLGMGMKPGTSPSIAAKSDGTYIVAFQTNTGELFSYSPITGVTDTDVAPKNGSSPSTVITGGSNYEIALMSSEGNALLYSSSAASAELGLGMGLGGSPSITASP